MEEPFACLRPAPGGPGVEPHWARGDKDAIGTAYQVASRVWYTLSQGILNEVYYPTVDSPQTRDLQYLVTDGRTFFHDETQLDTEVDTVSPHGLGVRVTAADPAGKYRIVKEIIAGSHEACVLVHTRLEASPEVYRSLKLYALCAPHLGIGGWHNDGYVTTVSGRLILTARRGDNWLALGADVPFTRCSCGYVGVNDGWQDLSGNRVMDYEFDCALDGNIALTGELDLTRGVGGKEFTLGLAFGSTFHNAVTALLQSLGTGYAEQRRLYHDHWQRTARQLPRLERVAGDEGRLYHKSESVLLAHEDKLYPGAMIASLSIPWGDAHSDLDDRGGYHLVWTRDLVNAATGLLATDNTGAPLRALIYLAISQRRDGGFYQNFWVDGDPYWQGVQLDEVAFPILLAWRLKAAGALRDFDPYPMVRLGASYLLRHGPATPQERWEEASGYSPSTLAACIAGLTCAATWARERGDAQSADLIQEYADFLSCHVEAWTVTTQGSLLPGVPRHYIRIHPVDVNDPEPDEDPNHGLLRIANRAPGQRTDFPARDVVDAGFLELVRYGIRKPGDPLIEDSLQVVDATLKVETPYGPAWHRYNHDGYGQRPDGGPYLGWGKGRAWPLLAGERAHYELATGRPVDSLISAMEGFSSRFGMLPEQVWDEADRPAQHLYLGRPTGSAMPLLWAHAEYVKLLRSASDGRVFDSIPQVAERYLPDRGCKELEVWSFNRHARTVRAGWTLRVQATAAFLLHWSGDEWRTVLDTRSTATSLGIEYVDIAVAQGQRAPIRFTFHWLSPEHWEGRDYAVAAVG